MAFAARSVWIAGTFRVREAQHIFSGIFDFQIGEPNGVTFGRHAEKAVIGVLEKDGFP
jgi:hypothetical protein